MKIEANSRLRYATARQGVEGRGSKEVAQASCLCEQERGIYAASTFAVQFARNFSVASLIRTLKRPEGRAPRPRAAFTIIEIALCLGIIAFALVAIIGALPTGLNVQKNNRERTIIGQDAQVWMDLLRSGAMGYDDLTNYVLSISNVWTTYSYSGGYSGNPNLPMWGMQGGTVVKRGADVYTNNGQNASGLYLNGANIIGLLSTPTWTAVFPGHGSGDYQSNYMIAYVRAMSGAAVEKVPQNNPTVLQDAFTYRMIVQNFPYAAVDTNGFCFECTQAQATNGFSADQLQAWLQARTNAAYSQWLLETNTHDIRLLFRWPVLPNGQIPNYGRYTFRDMANGELMQSNDTFSTPIQPLFFVQPSIYAEMTNTRPSPQ